MTITPEVSAKTLTQLVALQIKHAMVDADVRQSQLAREIGKTEQWLSVRLRGRQPIDVNDLSLIARALKVGVHELLPPPDVAARAAEPKVIAAYLPVTTRARDHEVSRQHNSPSGRRDSTHPTSGRRTARVVQSRRPKGS